MTSIQLIRQYLSTSKSDYTIFIACVRMHQYSGRPWHGQGYESLNTVNDLDDLWKTL